MPIVFRQMGDGAGLDLHLQCNNSVWVLTGIETSFDFHPVSFPSVHFPINQSKVHRHCGTMAVNYFYSLSNTSQQMDAVEQRWINVPIISSRQKTNSDLNTNTTVNKIITSVSIK